MGDAMSLPSISETYVQLNGHLLKAQECAATLAHLHNTESSAKDKSLAKGWLQISEIFKLLQFRVNNLAQGKLQ